jgi:predicted RNase H-like nuclease (RuvC/YqgF family)
MLQTVNAAGVAVQGLINEKMAEVASAERRQASAAVTSAVDSCVGQCESDVKRLTERFESAEENVKAIIATLTRSSDAIRAIADDLQTVDQKFGVATRRTIQMLENKIGSLNDTLVEIAENRRSRLESIYGIQDT